MEGVHFCKYSSEIDVAMEEEGSYTLSFGFEPVHVAYNTHLSSQAAVMLPNGAVNLWELETQNSITWSAGGTEYVFDDVKDTWKTCEFGAHPRTLLLADRNAVALGDLRVGG